VPEERGKMDIKNNSQPQSLNRPQTTANINPPTGSHNHKSHVQKDGMWYRTGIFVALLAVVVLMVGLITLIYTQNNNTKGDESKYIYTNKLQAVFLNTGQVYFGNIKVLNNEFLTLQNIFYLQSTTSSASSTATSGSNVTLVKLGCELHRPYDQMVINRAQVTFWENLQSSGQVAQAVAKYDANNPHGQTCSDQTAASGSTSSAVQSAGTGSSSTATTPATKP
jgi:hypothetical protein